jgi:hypothetical protein
MKTDEVMKILEENTITNVQPKHKCKGHPCEKDATIEDPKDHFYCDECYRLYSRTRKDYWSHPDTTGQLDKK